MTENNNTINKNDSSKILGIQFSILSPEEIRKGSVCEITSRDTYINNKPVINGLFDPRMGVLEAGLICPTDGLNYMQTPGYFGHINLARPVFYIQYLTSIIKILRCTCVKCSKLLISKESYKHFLDYPPDVRWNNIFSIASKIKRCGEDTNNGCGCKQPTKIKKEGLATLIAEWDSIEGIDKNENPEKLILQLTPEIVLTQFKRISDEDINFMGFSPLWSRPEWMICQVLAVPPPAVRPSVKHDSQQRSEDDITHIIVNIIKTNKTLQDKINTNAKGEIIKDWSSLLQYHISTLVDNNIPGVAVAAQRSGRPLKSIKERLNGKGGRVRGNLMGKRVDFSARSVITPDPNLSINELGVPKKIALNITRPVTVNKLNINFLNKLVQNGPDIYPGAKILDRLNGNSISLRYVDKDSIKLEYGDIVHRHIMNGDAVLFNRQPTLHRMSMMCHIVRIMNVGDTFRMNVADTKPYNADFDGDEMNMHMPQDIESESELKNLAAVKLQIISPANNKSIVGIFQDSLLGSYRFTRENINFTHNEAMNLLTLIKNIDISDILNKENITNFDILSQILPSLSLKYKTSGFKDTDNYSTSNNVLEIQNGSYIRGQMNKGVFGAGSVGLLQRLCNDFGNNVASEFIDNLQNIVTEYMKTSAYSVGISDLIANKSTINKITDVIISKKKEVQTLIDKTHLGIFENKTGKTDDEEIETQINNILGQALIEAGKIGRNSLQKDNRFVIMVDAGSKGSSLNISQMTSCVGQQTVDGKRIPYGFDNRTLPHYNKFDNSPEARGFVENSFISGLIPQELFFHAMGGRVGLIDTAVKTSQTGYIQRRLIKGMEDLKIEYDMTVRNNKNKIIQFSYGDDNFDTTTIENQKLPLVSMSLEEIYLHFEMSIDKNIVLYTNDTLKRVKKQKIELNKKIKLMIDNFIDYRKEIVNKVFNNTDSSVIHMPVAFTHIINNIQGQQLININSLVDITPLECFEIIENGLKKLKNLHYISPNKLFEILYFYYLNPKNLLSVKRLNRKSINLLVENIIYKYKKSIIAPGEMVGMIAAQSIGEPTTQMTLNTFHFAGVASKSNVTRGVPRVEEILSLSENPKNPSCTIYLFPDEETNKENTEQIRNRIEHTKLNSIVNKIQICFDPYNNSSLIEEDNLFIQKYNKFEIMIDECNNKKTEENYEKSNWIIRIELNKEEMLYKNITMDDIHFAIKNIYNDEIECIYSDYNDEKLIFRIRLVNIIKNSNKNKQKSLDQSDEIYKLKTFQDHLLNKMVLTGVKNIERVIPRKICNSVKEEEGQFVKKEVWVLDTVGTNLLEILSLDYIDVNRTYTNDIQEIKNILGIEAARQSIFNEITEVMEHDDTYINYHHISLLCDRMTCNDKMVSIFRHGINNDNIGPIAKASFEETPEMFLKAARHAELDNMRGVSANVMCGQEGYFGTSAFQTMLNIEKFTKLKAQQVKLETDSELIENSFINIENKNEPCSINNLTFDNNIENLNPTNTGNINDYELDF